VTNQTHRVAVDLVVPVPHRPTRRVRIAAEPADPMALDAIGAPALIVARGAAGDVPARGGPMEISRAPEVPSDRVRVLRVSAGGGEVLPSVTIGAEARPVAALTEGLVCPCLDGMPAEVIAPVNEVSLHAVSQQLFHGKRNSLGMAVLAKGLLVALATGGGRGAGDASVVSREVALVRKVRDRPEREAGEIDVARRALSHRVLAAMLVAGRTGAHRRNNLRLGATRLRKLQVALGTIVADALQVSHVRHPQLGFALWERPGETHVRMAEGAVAVGFLILVTLETFLFLGEMTGGQILGVVNGFMTDDTVQLRARMPLVREGDPVAVAIRVWLEDVSGASHDQNATQQEQSDSIGLAQRPAPPERVVKSNTTLASTSKR